jgi:hypothetical protein
MKEKKLTDDGRAAGVARASTAADPLTPPSRMAATSAAARGSGRGQRRPASQVAGGRALATSRQIRVAEEKAAAMRERWW